MRIGLILAFAVAATACTGGGSSSPSPSESGNANKQAVIQVAGRPYEQECTPVAEALVDVPLRSPDEPGRVRAITGLWFRQAVAVKVNDRSGCGIYTLALSSSLSTAARDGIEQEVRRGVEDFGVVASPVPKDPNNGMEG